MVNSGVSPEIVTFNIVIDALCKDGGQKGTNSLGVDVYKRCKSRCGNLQFLIDGLCNSGQWEEATKLFREMMGRGISPDVCTFNILIDAICKEGMVKRHMLFDLMIERGVEPDTIPTAL
ncbi:hypothetical protein GIB67_017301 [Kingdonia uniflora]|uniref:Pentatricopeptide repeat-containing protein n=1 Tax=Kingdonia uniflora TaxID=39325 RepID=A0A7J7MS76_9MAGN|nr:hypothetical protein GIB67_017301 [Kingdonia uniflora]